MRATTSQDIELPIPAGHRGILLLCPLPDERLLISTGAGFCVEIDPDSGASFHHPQIIGGRIPQGTPLHASIATHDEDPLCSVSTAILSTAIWRKSEPCARDIITDDCVSAVAFSPSADVLATGQGRYTLRPDSRPRARIQTFSTDDHPRRLAETVLPGFVVDQLVYHPCGDSLVAVTGMGTQEYGYLCVLDAPELRTRHLVEIDAVFCRGIAVDSIRELLILTYGDRIVIRRIDQPESEVWEWRPEGYVFSSVYDPERDRLVLSNGQIVEPHVGEVGRLPVGPAQFGVALMSDSRIATTSQDGRLQVFELVGD